MKLLAESMGNHLEPIATRLCPEISTTVKWFKDHGALNAQMTGSGSVVYGIYDDKNDFEKASRLLKSKVPAVFSMETSDCGVELTELDPEQ